MIKRKSSIFLILLISLAFLIRVWGLSQNPPSLNWDEVSQGYNAYSILKTGHDEWGKFLPLTNFRAYGDYPTTLYLYLAIPFIAVFGLNSFAIRLPSALCGALMVLIFYYLSKKIFKREDVSLYTASIAVISPWNFLLDRQVIQTVPALLLFTAGVWLFLKGIYGKRGWIIAGTLLLDLSVYAYHNTRILAPLFLVVLLLIYRKFFLTYKKILIAVIAISALFFIPVGFSLLSGQASARSVWVGILDQGAINDINQARGASPLPAPLSRLFINKVTYFGFKAAQNYIGYFDPFFLGVKGGSQYQFSVQGFGVLNMAEVPLFYLGLFFLLKGLKRQDREKQVLFFWLLLGPLPAVVTKDAYQVVRSHTMMPAVYLTIALGVSKVFDYFESRMQMRPVLTGGILFLLSLTTFFFYLYNFVYIYPLKYSQSWQYGYKQAIEYAMAHKADYNVIIFTKKYGEPHEFVLFYTRFDPSRYQTDPHLVRYFKSDWYWVDAFDHYRFINDWQIKQKTASVHNDLLITSPGNYPLNVTKLKTIRFKDGSPAFDILKLD